jgi:hypothetical protein
MAFSRKDPSEIDPQKQPLQKWLLQETAVRLQLAVSFPAGFQFCAYEIYPVKIIQLYIWPIQIQSSSQTAKIWSPGQTCLGNCKIERPEKILRKTFDEGK